MITIGTILIHPVHGEMTVTKIQPSDGAEYIAGEWRPGNTITAEFSRFIPGVQWCKNPGKNATSYLVFHEYYINRLEVKQ